MHRRYNQVRRALSLRINYNKSRSVISTIQPDVVYVWHMESVSISPILAAQDLDIPIVFRLPDYWLAQMRIELCLEPNPVKRWYRKVVSGLGGFDRLDTSHMLPNSKAVMQSYLEAGFSGDCMTVIPNGIPSDLILDANKLSTLPSSSKLGAARLLFAGRLVSEKAPDDAIKTLAYLVTELGVSRARLDIFGEGPEEYMRQLRDMVTHLGLEKMVSFFGRIEHSKLLECYTEYDALLLTSRWEEPFSRSLLEAMARGLPVVATNTGGTVEIISDGDNGLLVPADNPVAMAEAVNKLLSNPEYTQRIRYNALSTLRTKFLLDRIVEQVEAYLQTTVLQKQKLEGALHSSSILH
jgi:glycosyltransferase involved in cell wall biosynthesis